MASPQFQSLVAALRAGPPIDWSPNGREAFANAVGLFPAPEGIRSGPVSANGVPGEWIDVTEAGRGRTLFYLHGGGYTIGSVAAYRPLIARLCAAMEARAFAIDYRLAPEDPFPAAVDDTMAAYRWLIASGVEPGSVVIGGDSAGGGLTMAALVALQDAGDPLPGAAFCISPWADLELSGASATTRAAVDPIIDPASMSAAGLRYVGSADVRTPLASPIYADLARLPQLLIQAGDAEVFLDDATRLAEKAKAAGVDVTLEIWPEMVHVWHIFAAMLPEGQQAIDRIGEWVRARVPAGSAS
jgi:phosphinothricin tripeptide acetyl hydrolase